MYGAVLSWATATRPEPTWPEPSPLVWLNQGRCAGAFACVRTQTLCLPASVLISSISSRALLESPPGAGVFIVTVAMTFSSAKPAILDPYPVCPNRCCLIQGRRFRSGYSCPRKFASAGVDLGQRGVVHGLARKSWIALVNACG